MEKVVLKVRRLKGAKDLPLPYYESAGSSGMDIRAAVTDPFDLMPGEIRLIPTGLTISLPPGYEAQMRPRSGLALRHGIGMLNAPGTVDSDYRGEVGIILVNWGPKPFRIERGHRIAQMVISKVYRAELTEVSELDETLRGEGGFGHTGVL